VEIDSSRKVASTPSFHRRLLSLPSDDTKQGEGRCCNSKETMPRNNQALPLAGILLMGCFVAHAFVGTPAPNHGRRSVASCHRPASHLHRHPPSATRILSHMGRANEVATQHVAVGLKHRMLLRGGRPLDGGTALLAKQGRGDEEKEEEEEEEEKEVAGLEGASNNVDREEPAEVKETDDDDDDDDDDDETEIVRLQLAILMVKDRSPNPGLPSIGFDFSYLMINQNIEGEVCV
jgi:hypothetical protein